MNNLPKVSVVVPVYNGIEYLDMLFDRLHNQTYENIEVIMMDDLSSDDSFAKMKEFEAKDSRFKAKQVKHKGGCAVKAQVQGLPYCNGDYYFYASQDDFFDYDIIEKCVLKALDLEADIVLPNMVLYYEDKESVKRGDYPIDGDYNQVLSGKEAFELSLNWRIHAFALRKMSLFELEEFRADYYNSEEYYFRCMLLNANKIAFADSNFYYRQDNPNAITKTIKYFHVDILVTDMMLYELMSKQGYEKFLMTRRLKEITINWCRYCKRFALIKCKKHERQYINSALKQVAGKIMKSWVSILKMKEK